MINHTTNPTPEQENNVNIYLIDAGEVHCAIEDLGEIGTIYDDTNVVSMVFAKSPGQAKKLFIGFHDTYASYTRHSFEWTDKMSVRLLARDVDIPVGIMQDPDTEILDHCEERLTRFGYNFWLTNSEFAHTDGAQEGGEQHE
jgi:hypothetical protein